MNTELLLIGLLCGAILGSSLILLGIYCHWHFTRKNERGRKKKSTKEENGKNRLSRSQESTKCQQCQSPVMCASKSLLTPSGNMEIGRDRRKDSVFTEIDMRSSTIELVIHRSDGTLQRKKYNHASAGAPSNKSRANHSSYQSSWHPADMENGPLLGDNQTPLENHMRSLPEFGYVVAQQNGKRASISFSTTGLNTTPSTPAGFSGQLEKTSTSSLLAAKRTDIKPRLSFRSRDYQILVPEKPPGESQIMRRNTSAPVTGSSPNYSTRSSGYESADLANPRSPSPISPTRMRTLTRRITEIQAAQKRFKRFASLPNYRSGQNINPTIPEISDSPANQEAVKVKSSTPSSSSTLCLGLVGRPGPVQSSETSPRPAEDPEKDPGGTK
ncbi:Oidioi.mRNA.OKI2018_I69.PAR.g9883.t1.cds [Oikopleura dioica]|uniref:Oidioi.mRNA.OKI2018_I69.PAR.g9883.t1.cds n=1 Tax=Oikopleura dioica TaxID=34765 RepID=A0ABN7RMZ9_OIKDI|nr:Oidioi.mRNA.OKI2018_I69.PAR.g9883.t1.cds [Oikopleura dioica]